MKVLETLALEDVQPGMKVAAAVLDEAGRVLLPAAAEITEAMLAGLARRQIALIQIEREAEDDPAVRAAQQQLIVSRLDRIFRQAGTATATRLLYQAVLEHRQENPQ